MSDFSITLQPGKQRLEWFHLLGAEQIPVTSYAPSLDELTGYDEPQPVYYLDVDRLKGYQRQRLTRQLAARFGLSRREVQRQIHQQGVPIPARECVLHVKNPYYWFGK